MHILIGMAIVTLLIIGVFVGNLFACVFLSLLPAAYLLLAMTLGTTNSAGWALACVVLLCVIWGPRWLYVRSRRQSYRIPVPPKPAPPYGAGPVNWIRHDLAIPAENSCLKSLTAAITICAAVSLVMLPLFPH